MTDKSWKRAERRVAGILGGQRVPVSGRGRGDNPDVEHPVLSIEVKSRKTLPKWIRDALDQAKASSLSAGEARIPVAVLHEQEKPYSGDLVVMELGDLARLLVEDGAGRSS